MTLRDFLTKNKAITDFKKNLVSKQLTGSCLMLSEPYSPDDWMEKYSTYPKAIEKAFDWTKVKGGCEYWGDLADEFRRQLKKNKRKGK